jgi:hypothetical protein
MNNLRTHYMTLNDCYTAGRKIIPKGIMIHSTATPGVMAAQWFPRWNKSFRAGETDRQVCVHAFVDDKEVWQYLPWNHRGWHGGVTANDLFIGIELCEPTGHRYDGSQMVNYDAMKNTPYFHALWRNAVTLCVMLCEIYGLNDTQIIDHAEGFRRGLATNSADVGHWFPLHHVSMDTFRAAVGAALSTEEGMSQEVFNRMFAEAMTKYNTTLANQPPSGWAKETWDKAVSEGIFDGTMPRAPLTREQAAMVLSRLR